MLWKLSASGSLAVQRAVVGSYIRAPKSRSGTLALRKDWDSLPEKSQRLGSVSEPAAVPVAALVAGRRRPNGR